MHFSALLIAFVALFTTLTLASPAAYEGLYLRGTDTALNTTMTFNTTLMASTNVSSFNQCLL